MSLIRLTRSWPLAGILVLCTTGALVAQHGRATEVEPAPTAVDGVFERAVGPHILGNDSVPDLIVSPGAGSTPTQILDGATGALLGAGFPFGPGFLGGVRMAAGDLTGDAVADLVMGMGPGGGLVSLLNGSTITPIGAGYPFGPGFGGGLSVAVGDFNADGRNDIVTGQASGGGAIAVFSGVNYTPLLSVTPFGPGYGGGVNVAAGDFTGDGRADLLVGQASGGGIALVNGATGAVLASVAPYGAVNGVFTALGDVNADGRADLIAAPGSGNGPVLVFDFNAGVLLAAFSPYPATSTGGVRVAATDVTGDGRAEILTVPGPGVAATLLVFDGATFANIRSYPALPPAFTGGALIAAPAATGLQFSTPAAAAVVVGTEATVPVRAVGSPPVSSLTVAGALPSGLTFTHSGAGVGQIAGTPGAGTGGTYPLTFTASNGVTTRTQAFTLTVNQAPAITSATSAAFNLNLSGTFTVTTSGFPAPTVTLSGALPAGVTFTPGANGTGTIAGTPAAGTAGSYPLTITATNGVGSAATQSFTLTVQAGPAITSAASTAFTTGVAATFTVTTSASPAVTSMTATGALPTGVTFTYNGDGTATLAGTPAAGTGGTYPLTIAAVNAAGTGTQNFTLTVQQAPAITSVAGTTFLQGAAGSFTVTATGFPQPALTVTGVLPTGVTFVDNGNGTGLLAGTPAAGTGGSYAVTLRAGNGVGAEATQPFTLNVNAPPAFTSAPGTTFTVGVAGSFTVTTTGGPAPTIALTGALPTGVTFTNNGNGTATIAGTPAAATGGTYAVSLGATNGVGAPAAQNFTLTVQQAPAITSSAATAFSENIAGSFTVTTTGFPVGAITSTGALPAGVTFTDNGNGTATLAGTPALGTPGAYPLQFSASNGVGSAATQPFTLTVNSCGAAVVVAPASGALTAGTYNSAYSQTISATGGTGHTFAVTSGALPAGVTLGSGGALSGSPTVTGAFTFTVTATASGGCVGSASYSLTVAPDAQAETFLNGVGNTQYSVGAGTPSTPAVVVAGTVLSNDAGPGTLTAGPAGIATTNGGQVAMSTDGSFLYTPAAGFAGPSDTFTYTLTDGNGITDTAVVTINLSGVVWYVNAAAAAGDGRSNSPFNSMPAAATAAQTGQVIYVHPGAPTGATVLRAGQTLQGAGETFILNGLTIPAGAAPTLSGTITLANGVAVRALSVNAGASPSVSASALTGTETLTSVSITGGATGLELTGLAGTFTMTGGSISGVAGAAVAIDGGTGTIDVGAAVTSTTGRSVSVQNRTAGTVTFSGAISDSSAGVLLTSNTGSTIAFTGGLALNTGANDAFTATGGGTIVALQNNTTIVNSIATTEGTALRVVNTEIGSAGLTFRSISAGTSSSSPGNGIVLDTTGVGLNNGGLTVTGNGTATAFSGGTIRRKSGADGSLSSGIGAYLNSTKNPSFNYMQFFWFQNAAILGRNVSGFTLENSVVDTAGSLASGAEGPLVFGAPNPSGVNGLIGTGVIRNTNIINGVQHNVAFYNQSGTMSLTVENTTGVPGTCQIGFNSPTTGEHGLLLQLEGTAVGTAVVQSCRLRANRSAGLYATAADTASLTVTVDGGEMVYTGQGANGIVLLNSGDAALTATITDNYFSSMTDNGLRVGQASGNATATSLLRATISGNTFDSAAGATGSGITAALSGTAGQASRTRLLIDSNQVNQYSTAPGILVDTPDAGTSPEVSVTVTNNHVDMRENPPASGIVGTDGLVLRARQTGVAMCASVSSNTSHWFPTTLGAGGGILAEQASSAAFLLERGGEALATPAATVLANNNLVGPAGASTTSVLGTLTVAENGTCLLPSAP